MKILINKQYPNFDYPKSKLPFFCQKDNNLLHSIIWLTNSPKKRKKILFGWQLHHMSVVIGQGIVVFSIECVIYFHRQDRQEHISLDSLIYLLISLFWGTQFGKIGKWVGQKADDVKGQGVLHCGVARRLKFAVKTQIMR